MVNRSNAAPGNFRFQPTTPQKEPHHSVPPLPVPASRLSAASQPQRTRSPLVQKFFDLPIGRKQLLALLVCELVPILGLGIGTIIVLTNSLRSQLHDQSKSEIAVTETNYNIKVNQMGFGSRGQSDNAAIINAAKTQADGEALNLDLQTQVQQILRNEVKAHRMEYATLVGKDLRIIASANADRKGESFDPNGLVSEALRTSHQIKANAIAPWTEIVKETPLLPSGFNQQDALIRYVVTPVKDLKTQEVIGALVFGDLVNNKLPIVENTLNSFGSGYSGVYLRRPNGEFALATAVERGNPSNPDLTYRNIAISDPSLLQEAATIPKGEAVTRRLTINGVSYTVTARAMPNKIVETGDGAFPAFSSQPAAILVRGTPENNLNNLLRASLLQEGIVLSLGLLMVLLWSAAFRRAVIKPLKNLEQATQNFAWGDRRTRATIFFNDEVGQLATLFNYMADGIVSSEQALANEVYRQQHQTQEARLLSDVIANIRRSLHVEDIIRTSVNEIREFMKVERVLLYRFNDDYKSGTITAESVTPGWAKGFGQTIYDPLTEEALERFNSGKVSLITNWEDANLSHCHCEILEQLQVKANMVAPIKFNNRLFGLLCAHQCSGPRDWADTEIDFFEQLATQVGYALDQTHLLRQQEETAERTRQLYEITLNLRKLLEPNDILNTAVKEVREALSTDRAIVYMFDEKWQGTIIAESVKREFPLALNSVLYDPCFAESYVEKYRQGRVQATPNIHTADLTPCHLSQLEPFQVKANMVAPILANNKLLGLLIVHQCAAPRVWTEIEIDFFRQVAIQLGFTLDQTTLQKRQQETAKRTRQLYDITLNMRQTLHRQEILNIVVREVREALAVERAVVYWFDDRWHGTFISESVSRGYPVALGSSLYDPCFADRYVEKYRQGRVQATPDIHHAGLTPCHLSQLEPYEVKANLVAPILANQTLLGLLIVHQCSAPREWLDSEIDFMRQLAVQLGLTLDRALLFEAKEQSRLAAEALSTEQRQQKEGLQQQLVSLLGDVEDAAMGDLTVRADVTAGDIGTVADFFNSIVESLRQIVTQVQASAEAVTQAVGSNETEIQGLAQQALQQAQEITRTLDSVGAMTHSIETVAARARQAAVIAHQASSTAEAGGNAMDLTVDNILELRATIGETAKKVKRLGESSQQISKVVSLINQIALQTNLLAINAGIEAARAGEEGQGFAVVAEEVGELAARSAAATREIEHLVEAIQRETSEVVEAMEQGTAQVVQGTHLVENAKHSLSQMQAVTHEIDALVQSISESTVSQVDTAQTIRQLMQAVAAVAERTSLSSRQVSDSLRQTVEVTQELQASVGTFKVG